MRSIHVWPPLVVSLALFGSMTVMTCACQVLVPSNCSFFRVVVEKTLPLHKALPLRRRVWGVPGIGVRTRTLSLDQVTGAGKGRTLRWLKGNRTTYGG